MQYRPYICPFGALIEQVPRGATVLDIGCGGGLFLTLLAASGQITRGTGFDTSQPMIDLATETALQRGLPLTFLHLDAEAGWPDGQFDVISMIDVMHHIPPAVQHSVLERLAHHVRPGGRLIYKDMCCRPRWRALANRAHDLLLARQWVHYFPVDQADALFRDAGLAPISSQDTPTLWYGHELRVYDRPASS